MFEFPLINQHETLQVGMSYQDTIEDWFYGQLDCKILANLLKLEVLKYIIMHSSHQIPETLTVGMSYQDTIEDWF